MTKENGCFLEHERAAEYPVHMSYNVVIHHVTVPVAYVYMRVCIYVCACMPGTPRNDPRLYIVR